MNGFHVSGCAVSPVRERRTQTVGAVHRLGEGEAIRVVGDPQIPAEDQFGVLGELAQPLFVERDLRRIFDYRQQAVRHILDAEAPPPATSAEPAAR